MNEPQNLEDILQGRFNPQDELDTTNYDLHNIPLTEWGNYEYAHLQIPEGMDNSSVAAACLWLENYYGFKEKGFAAYVSSDHYGDDKWHPSTNGPSGFYFIFGDTTEGDDLAEKIYAQWKKEGKAERENHTMIDALALASKIICEKDIEEALNDLQ
jgi:hypothetical protein